MEETKQSFWGSSIFAFCIGLAFMLCAGALASFLCQRWLDINPKQTLQATAMVEGMLFVVLLIASALLVRHQTRGVTMFILSIPVGSFLLYLVASFFF